MSSQPFNETDLRGFRERSLRPEQVLRQIAWFKDPPPSIRLDRPAIPGDGIHVIPSADAGPFLGPCREAADQGRCLKFVPASGAATRMFDPLLKEEPEAVRRMIHSIKEFAFYEDLAEHLGRSGRTLDDLIRQGEHAAILRALLSTPGLGYAQLPKGLVKFHRYPGGARTAMQEHLVDAAGYVRDASGVCRLHFTVLPEHRREFEEALERVRRPLEKSLGVQYRVGFSEQEPSTETLAMDPDNRPFRDEEGNLVFRPGGHGALLANLSGLDGDLVFIRNIDNVAPDRSKGTAFASRKLLAGVLAHLQAEIHSVLRRLDRGDAPSEWLPQADAFRKKWFFRSPLSGSHPEEEAARLLTDELDRPLRVCGMVPNAGEPGGGPYWVREKDGRTTLQVVEATQVDLEDGVQKAVFKASTHFNPVDLVCGLRDHRGRSYDLQRYVNQDAVLITQKARDGKLLKALEWPGLWNGSMHGWNSVFVEVPLETFNPVKTLFDLLRPQHRS